MTEDQIKAIAEEYAEAEFVMSYATLDMNVFFAKRFLNFLNKKYCIVEREKVKEHHKAHMDKMKQVSSARAINRAKAIALEQIFGTSMFNQNESENGTNN